MKNLKNQIFLILFLSSFITTINAQEKIGDNLSFMKGQRNIKFEFVYDGLTIDDLTEKAFFESGSKDSKAMHPDVWQREKSGRMPENFLKQFNVVLKKNSFQGDTLDKKQKYVCVVRLISIKTGKKNIVSPTLWVSYTFYENANREKPLAFLKYHVPYAKGGQRQDGSHMEMGDWSDAYAAYWKAGDKIAGDIKKKIK